MSALRLAPAAAERCARVVAVRLVAGRYAGERCSSVGSVLVEVTGSLYPCCASCAAEIRRGAAGVDPAAGRRLGPS